MLQLHPVRALAVLAIATVSLAACGSDEKAQSGPVTVEVALKEWKFEPSITEAKAGTIAFKATNNGKEVHELVLFKSDLAPEKLPVDQDGAVDEKGEGLEFIDEVEDVKPNETKTFSADLKPGTYVMACNVIENGEKHFMRKMYATFTVTE